ncbi:MAG: stage II sporulation protein R [Bacillota bacterium]|nr:stage II sporulation protein R [Bacillota bacterium]
MIRLGTNGAGALRRRIGPRLRGRRLGETVLALALLVATGALLAGPLRGVAAGEALVASRGGPAGLVQLHFRAASDAPADQRLKQAVVRALLPVIVRDLSRPGLPPGRQGTDLLLERARERSSGWAAAARQVLRRAGSDEQVQVAVGRFPYPAKRTGSLWLPAGVYPAVEVRLGAAQGHNWWCLLFPQLCLPLASARQAPAARPASGAGSRSTIALAPADPAAASGGAADAEVAFRLNGGTLQLSRQEEAPRFRLAVWDWFREVAPQLARGLQRGRFLLAEP